MNEGSYPDKWSWTRTAELVMTKGTHEMNTATFRQQVASPTAWTIWRETKNHVHRHGNQTDRVLGLLHKEYGFKSLLKCLSKSFVNNPSAPSIICHNGVWALLNAGNINTVVLYTSITKADNKHVLHIPECPGFESCLVPGQRWVIRHSQCFLWSFHFCMLLG